MKGSANPCCGRYGMFNVGKFEGVVGNADVGVAVNCGKLREGVVEEAFVGVDAFFTLKKPFCSS
jgi:hypothetical protein